LKYYPQTSSAISFTNFIFAHCCSSVNLFPISQEAHPHCGLKYNLSKETYLDASFILFITVVLFSNSGDFVVINPSTTFLFSPTDLSGWNPPERSSSYSK